MKITRIIEKQMIVSINNEKKTKIVSKKDWNHYEIKEGDSVDVFSMVSGG